MIGLPSINWQEDNVIQTADNTTLAPDQRSLSDYF
jgi:hypothetical protein